MKLVHFGSLAAVPLLIVLAIYTEFSQEPSEPNFPQMYSGDISGNSAVRDGARTVAKNPLRQAQARGAAFHANITPAERMPTIWHPNELYQTDASYQHTIRPTLLLNNVVAAPYPPNRYSRHRPSKMLAVNNQGFTPLYSATPNRAGGIIADEQGTIFGGRVTRASARSQRSSSLTKPTAKTIKTRNVPTKVSTPIAQVAVTAKPTQNPTPNRLTESAKDGAFTKRRLKDGRVEIFQGDDRIAIVTDLTTGTVVALEGPLAVTHWEQLCGELFLFTSLPDMAGMYVGDGFKFGELPDDSFLRVVGLQSGDVLTAIDGVSIEYITSENIGSSIVSSRVGMSIVRDGQARTVLLTRKIVGAAKESTDGVEAMKRFKIGDHVSWNSEAGKVSGTIIAVHTTDFEYKGYTHRASAEDPQYEIKSDKTDHIAAHKGSALSHAK